MLKEILRPNENDDRRKKKVHIKIREYEKQLYGQI